MFNSKKKKIIIGSLIALTALAVVGAIVFRPKPPVTADSVPLPTPSPTPIDETYELVIPKLNVHAPIVLNVDGTNDKVYLAAIENGVAQYDGTAKPGEKGNVFIFGHSSYYKNKPGNYKEVFKDLNQLNKDDVITITHANQILTYKVTASKTIGDSDDSVLDQPSDKEMLTLMTCWPPGTTTKRFIVQADRAL